MLSKTERQKVATVTISSCVTMESCRGFENWFRKCLWKKRKHGRYDYVITLIYSTYQWIVTIGFAKAEDFVVKIYHAFSSMFKSMTCMQNFSIEY